MPFGGEPPVHLGVDLIELKKAKDFYKRHKKRLDSFFTKNEIFYIGNDSGATRRVAELLAAKEAVFKASGKTWMGPQGFGKSCLNLPPGMKIYFTKKNKKYVVAQCVGI